VGPPPLSTRGWLRYDAFAPFLDRTKPDARVLEIGPGLGAVAYRLALRFHNELPGIVVPDELQDALRDAGADAADVGMAHAKRLLHEARDRVAGVYLVVPYRQPLRVLELLDA